MEITPISTSIGSAFTLQSTSETANAQPIILSEVRELKISPTFQRTFEFYIQLQSAAGKHNLRGMPDSPVDLSDALERITDAYEQMQAGLNESSDNSQKHSKFLNDAFEMLTNNVFQWNAERLSMNVTGSTVEAIMKDGVNPFVESSQKQAKIFSDTFLKEYKKNGKDALSLALAKLNEMPKTTSLYNINFSDFKVLNTKLTSQTVISKDTNTINALLQGNDLSDYMKGVLDKSYDYYKSQNNGYGMLLPRGQSIQLDILV